MKNKQPLDFENTLAGQRQIAASRLMRGEDFLTVASDYQISPRTLLAWRQHEYGKWSNDPHEGRGDGPSRDYDGEWPSEEEELAEYATMRLDPARLLDEALRERYIKFLQRWNAK